MVGSASNEVLAESLTNAVVQEEIAADGSLAAAVRSLAACEDLLAGPRRTHEG